jgi:hypothetical protein
VAGLGGQPSRACADAQHLPHARRGCAGVRLHYHGGQLWLFRAVRISLHGSQRVASTGAQCFTLEGFERCSIGSDFAGPQRRSN